MNIKKTYYGKINGFDAMTCDFVPEDMTVEKEETVLYPEEGYILEKDGEQFDCYVIKKEKEAKSFSEVKLEEESEE